MSFWRGEEGVGRAEAGNSALGEEQGTISLAHAPCRGLNAVISSIMCIWSL